MADKTNHCIVPDCSGNKLKRGMCNKHYLRWWKYGDALAGGTGTGDPEAFILNMLQAPPTDECIVWPFGRRTNGYGSLGGSRLAHRYVCEVAHGKPEDGSLALHSCGNGHLGCVNKDHLRWGSATENYNDSVVHGTAMMVGEKNHNAKLSEGQVREILALKGIETHASIAKRYGLESSSISMIMSGKNWSHISAGSIITPWHIETADGLVWTGAGFSYDDLDAQFFDTEEDALFEIHSLDLQEVFVERFTRYSSATFPKIYDATSERAAA